MSEVDVEQLGEVRFPSGQVMVVDTGLLNLWCHDRPPQMPDGVLSSEDDTRRANAARDFRIDGADAARAARLLEWQPQARWVYDVPADGVAELERSFAALVADHHLDARLFQVVPRVSHLLRARHAIAEGDGAGGFLVHGVPMVACGMLPRGEKLPVVGQRRGAEPYADCWDWVGVQITGSKIVRSLPAGTVGVDWARLMFVDLDALEHWDHDRLTDGRADFVFWGRDAAAAAKRFGAAPLDEEGTFGFADMTIDDAIARCTPIEEAVERGELRMAIDFRPHTQHYQLLAQMRPSKTQSGTLALGDSICCAFFTSWGDGHFPVFLDVDAEGRLVRLRIQLETPQTLRNMDAVNGR